MKKGNNFFIILNPCSNNIIDLAIFTEREIMEMRGFIKKFPLKSETISGQEPHLKLRSIAPDTK